MQVILKQDVEKIGRRGDIVEVSRGYVRNFLVPRGLAEAATPAKMEEAHRQMVEAEERDRRMAERAGEVAEMLNKSGSIGVASGWTSPSNPWVPTRSPSRSTEMSKRA
jgi:large subunit ribosomal protein L9